MPTVQPGRYVLFFEEIDEAHARVVGAKGAGLARLSRVEGVRVPPGFCVTTDAYRRTVAGTRPIAALLDELSRVGLGDAGATRRISEKIRGIIAGSAIPDEVTVAVEAAVDALGQDGAFAVRSSATAEDLPTASFAGQHDSYLNVRTAAAILREMSRCWASLFTERAVTYRQTHGIDPRKVQMAVVVQEMVAADAAGALFTADPVTSNRRTAAVEAVPGLGEALVSGLVTPDVYRVRNGQIVVKTVAAGPPVLGDAQVVRLVELGRRIEAALGRPQDIEWCLAGDGVRIVQSRPITTLFPIPAAGDDALHVYVSVGHGQMMTDAMRPLGLSVFQLTAGPPMLEAGGRLFVDVTQRLASPANRAGVIDLFSRSDPLLGDAVRTVVERGDLIRSVPDEEIPVALGTGPPMATEPDPSLVQELIARTESSIAALRRDITAKSGPALFEFIRGDIQELKRLLFNPDNHRGIMAGIEATWWLNDHLSEWLGEPNAADALTRSAPGNVTSEMGLALLDVADAIRPHRAVVALLERAGNDGFLEELETVEGGAAARGAIEAWLDSYGMRCVGEIDITRPRWSERPAMLVPLILANVRNFEPGARRRRIETGAQEARRAEQDLLGRVRALPDGAQRAGDTKRMIDRLRTFIGYREYPKYGIIARYFLYKRALLAEAHQLVRAGVVRDAEDVFYLTFGEFEDAVVTNRVTDGLIERRRDDFRSFEALTPPRVLTSEGEVIAGRYRREAPGDALIGLAVSSGVVEGRARVIADIADADLEPGDILVTTHTDPSWTPVFVTVAGLVTEVGGLMTHGAVIAREYGLPAVVGVEDATRLIPDGGRVRVDGTQGFVELLPGS